MPSFLRGGGMVGETWVYAETKFRRPVLTSLLWAVVFGPMLTLLFGFGLSWGTDLEHYLAILAFMLAVVTAVNLGFVRRHAMLLPPVLTKDEAAEVIRSVWLGTDLARPRLAFAAILYSQRLLDRRTDIRLLVLGCALVLVAVFGPWRLHGPARLWFTGLMLLFGLIALAYFAGVHLARRRHAEALRKAEGIVRNS